MTTQIYCQRSNIKMKAVLFFFLTITTLFDTYYRNHLLKLRDQSGLTFLSPLSAPWQVWGKG